MRTQLEQAKISSSINYLFNGDERLLMSFFHHKGLKLRTTPHELISEAKRMGHNEFIIFQIALGFIDDDYQFYFSHILELETDYLINFVKALIHLKELNLEVHNA